MHPCSTPLRGEMWRHQMKHIYVAPSNLSGKLCPVYQNYSKSPTYKAIDILVSYISEQQFGAWNESSIFGSTIGTKSIICISPYFLTLTVFQHRPILFQTTLARVHLLVVKETNSCFSINIRRLNFFNLYLETKLYGNLVCQRMNYEELWSLETKDGPLNILSQIYLGFRCVSSSLDTFFLFSLSSASTLLWSTDY